jgi:hypothetical protein
VDLLLGANAINRFLHLAVAAITPFCSVGGRRYQPIVEKSQGLFQIGGLKLAQGFSDRLEAADPPP